jgi:VWFA-related protein
MPVFRSFVSAVFLLSVAAGLFSPAKSQTARPTTTTIRVASDLVYLDVTVVDRKGSPVVTGLTKDDFTITENGRPQRIFSFDPPAAGNETSAGASPAARPETVQVPNTKTAQKGSATILVLDLMNTASADSAYARDSIRRYLVQQPDRLASPTELMVLSNTALNMVQPYTHRRDDLLYALYRVPPETPYKLGSMQYGSQEWFDQSLAQSIEALQQIALQNRGQAGRKNILWVGYGGPSIPIDPGDPLWDKEIRFYVRGTTNMLVDARISLFLIRPEALGSLTLSPDHAKLSKIEGSLAQTATNGDPFAGTVNFGLFINGTGGRFFSKRNDIDRAIAEAQELGSKYYTLTYQPQARENNGEFREIKVVLRDPDLRPMTKAGYFAPEVTTNADSTPHHLDPMYQIEEAAQSGFVFDSLGVSLVHVARHPDSESVEVRTLLKSTHLHWQSTSDGRSTADITVAAVSLSKQRDILASRMRRLTIFSNSQDPASLAASETPVTITVPTPHHTESVRVVVLAQEGGQVGALEVEHKELVSAPESPTPEPQLQQRPGVPSQQRP